MTDKNTNETLNEELQENLEFTKEQPQEDIITNDEIDEIADLYWWQRW